MVTHLILYIQTRIMFAIIVPRVDNNPHSQGEGERQRAKAFEAFVGSFLLTKSRNSFLHCLLHWCIFFLFGLETLACDSYGCGSESTGNSPPPYKHTHISEQPAVPFELLQTHFLTARDDHIATLEKVRIAAYEPFF